ncbi:MAG: helix-turn-helix domain-containing protein [Candidatus Heimdallarchaeota archaeon]
MVLNWSNDPLLYDEQPILYNDWLTANDLIEQGHLNKIINEDLSFTNIYGIMVRKIDFVRKTSRDRIIARFPFIILEGEAITFLRKNILTLSELTRDYFYRSINKTIMEWKKIILNYLKKGKLPYPIYRCSFEVDHTKSTHCNTNPLIYFASARGEAFTFPTKVTNMLAYLCGVSNGDGNLRDYWLIVVDETKEHIIGIQSFLYNLFSKEGKLIKVSGAWTVKLNLLWAARLFNFLTGQTIDYPKYDSLREPLIFKQQNKDLRINYWRGMMDSDGSYSKYAVNFSTASERLKDDFSSFLSDNDIAHNYSVITYPNSDIENYAVFLLSRSQLDFCNFIGSDHPKKKKQLEKLILRKSKQRYQDRILQVNEQRLNDDGSFNYSFAPRLQIFVGEYLQQLRKITLTEFSKRVKINRTSIFEYEHNKQAIPLLKLKQILELTKQPFTLTSFLYENKITKFYLHQSYAALPLQPSNKLLQLINHLKIKQGYVTFIGLEKNDLTPNEIYSFFAIQNNPDKQLWNAALVYFFNTFFIIDKNFSE